VKVRLAIANLKGNLDHGVKSFALLTAVIACRIEGYAVRSGAKDFVLGQQLSTAAVAVRAQQTQHTPFTGRLLSLEPHRNVFRRLAQSDI
jgi:hypothetical protein